MSDLVGNPEDRFSRVAAHIATEKWLDAGWVCSIFQKKCTDQGPGVQNLLNGIFGYRFV